MKPGDQVHHNRYGDGIVVEVRQDGKVSVDFDSIGTGIVRASELSSPLNANMTNEDFEGPGEFKMNG